MGKRKKWKRVKKPEVVEDEYDDYWFDDDYDDDYFDEDYSWDYEGGFDDDED